MTNALLIPRLPRSLHQRRLDELAQVWANDGLPGVRRSAALGHPQAAPAATGGARATEAELEKVANGVRSAVEPFLLAGTVSQKEQQHFDLLLGRSLHQELPITPADAGHSTTWAFLSLVLVPDVAAVRYPPDENGRLEPSRFDGGGRTVLRRAWTRYQGIGDMLEVELDAGRELLAEDALVQLFERTAFSRNRRLLRASAGRILRTQGRDQGYWRALSKALLVKTGPRMLDVLDDAELEALVEDVHRQVVQ